MTGDPTTRSGSRSRPSEGGIASQKGIGVVPEHEVKAMLARHGVAVPRGTTDAATAGALRSPLVVKAFGEGIVHKSELGAVRLGVTHDALDGVVADLLRVPGAQGVLVEEQAAPGRELLVGVVDRGFGPALAIGMGGTLTEVIDDVALRLLPITEDDVIEMLATLRSHELLLGGYRGTTPIDQAALVATVLGVCALAEELGDTLSELECNPVIATPDGAIAVDARLVLDDDRPQPPADTDFTALFAPRGVAVAGASTSKQTFGNRFLDAYRASGWTEGLAAIHPKATDIGGVPAYASLRDVPHPVDYVLAAVPAAACADLVADAAGIAPFVHVVSGGFSEAAGRAGHDLEWQLLRAAQGAGVRVLGPNCMGVFAPAGRQTFQLDVPTTPGPVSVISQSGGLAGDIIKGGAARGVTFSKLVTMGNSIDVAPGEMCEWLVADPDTQIIGLYVEDPRDGARLARAFGAARDAGKAVVVLVGGLSTQGGRAVASHTGALAGDRRMWQAVSQRTGCRVVATLEELLGALAYVQRWRDVAPAEVGRPPSTLVVGVGGGASVLTTDACDRAGLSVRFVDGDVQERLRAMGYGAGTSVANPIEIPYGPAAPPDAFRRVLTPILEAQAYRDVLVHVNVQAFFSYATDGGTQLSAVADAIADLDYPATRVAFVARNLEVAPAAVAGDLLNRCRELGVQVFRTADDAAVAISAAQRGDR